MIEPGEAAPDFTLPAHTGVAVRLYDLLATGPAVVFFYARDGTPL
jgi:peroxiredoxin